MAAICELCGGKMPKGEEMFKFHGYSGPCPKPPMTRVMEIDIPQRWIKGYVDELIAVAKDLDPNSTMAASVAARASAVLDMVEAFRGSNHGE